MQRLTIYLLAALFLIALLSVTMTYSVRFTEAAVVTTFGKASEQSTIREPGMRFKWPYPVQSVTTYDTRARLLETRLEAQQTADDRQIIVEAFMTWRVSDPLEFFRRFSNAGRRSEDHFERASDQLRSLLRTALAETGSYRLDELFTPDIDASKIPNLEAQVLAAMRGESASSTGDTLADFGIEAISVGISRVLLPEETTQAVAQRMIANRDKLAKTIESEGEARATEIMSRAESDRRRIIAFAEERAKQIRAAGDIEASDFLGQMNELPELAVFLKNMELLRESFGRRITLVWTAGMPGLSLLSPDALSDVQAGQIPSSNLPKQWNGEIQTPLATPTSYVPPRAEPAAGDDQEEDAR